MNFEDLKQLLDKKKTEPLSAEDVKKVQIIEELFQNKNCFFEMDSVTSVNILNFLGIPKEQIKECYYSLLGPENYQNIPKVRYGIDFNSVEDKEGINGD